MSPATSRCVFTVVPEQVMCVFPRRAGGHEVAEPWMDCVINGIERGVYQESVLTKTKLKTSIFLKARTKFAEVLLDIMSMVEENGWSVVAIVGDSKEKHIVATRTMDSEDEGEEGGEQEVEDEDDEVIVGTVARSRL